MVQRPAVAAAATIVSESTVSSDIEAAMVLAPPRAEEMKNLFKIRAAPTRAAEPATASLQTAALIGSNLFINSMIRRYLQCRKGAAAPGYHVHHHHGLPWRQVQVENLQWL